MTPPKLSSLSPSDKTKMFAELDEYDWSTKQDFQGGCWMFHTGRKETLYCKPELYLESRDVLMPIIKRLKLKTFCGCKFEDTFAGAVSEQLNGECYSLIDLLGLTAQQLGDALLVATGKASV